MRAQQIIQISRVLRQYSRQLQDEAVNARQQAAQVRKAKDPRTAAAQEEQARLAEAESQQVRQMLQRNRTLTIQDEPGQGGRPT